MDKTLLHRAIAKWGPEVQIHKLQEELLELALVLNQRKCPTKTPVQMEALLYQELADVKIMMAQAEIIFDSERIDDIVVHKLDVLKHLYF